MAITEKSQVRIGMGVLCGILGSGAVGYMVWSTGKLMDIGERVARIEGHIGNSIAAAPVVPDRGPAPRLPVDIATATFDPRQRGIR